MGWKYLPNTNNQTIFILIYLFFYSYLFIYAEDGAYVYRSYLYFTPA